MTDGFADGPHRAIATAEYGLRQQIDGLSPGAATPGSIVGPALPFRMSALGRVTRLRKIAVKTWLPPYFYTRARPRITLYI